MYAAFDIPPPALPFSVVAEEARAADRGVREKDFVGVPSGGGAAEPDVKQPTVRRSSRSGEMYHALDATEAPPPAAAAPAKAPVVTPMGGSRHVAARGGKATPAVAQAARRSVAAAEVVSDDDTVSSIHDSYSATGGGAGGGGGAAAAAAAAAARVGEVETRADGASHHPTNSPPAGFNIQVDGALVEVMVSTTVSASAQALELCAVHNIATRYDCHTARQGAMVWIQLCRKAGTAVPHRSFVGLLCVGEQNRNETIGCGARFCSRLREGIAGSLTSAGWMTPVHKQAIVTDRPRHHAAWISHPDDGVEYVWRTYWT